MNNSLALKILLKLSIEVILYSSVLLFYDVPTQFIVWYVLSFILVVRIFVILLMFFIAWLYRVKPPADKQIGWLQIFKMILFEFGALLAFYFIFYPAERWLGLRQPAANVSTKGLPLLFVHGFTCNGGYWWAMQRFLRRRNITNMFTINLEPIFADIDQFAQQVAARVEHICALTKAEQVILIGHSMGGLVSRAYLQHHGGEKRVAKIITLGSPHHGSEHARLIGGINVRQMRPRSAWLTQLNQIEKYPPSIPLTSIYSYHDNLVTPQDTALLTCAKNIPMVGIGHLSMVFAKELQEQVYTELLEFIEPSHTPSKAAVLPS